MTSTDANRIASLYLEQRERDWRDFTSRDAPTRDYWAEWDDRSFGWKVPIEFLQPLGLEFPDAFEPLRPLLETLEGMREVDVPPVEWLHLTYVHIGFLRPQDVLWSQVESFYVNASPRVRRVEPFSMRLGGISVAGDERIYLGVDDGGSYREARRQVRLGVPLVYEKMKDDPLITPEGDAFIPTIDIGFFTGEGDRRRVIEALEPHREIDLGEVAPTHLKMARLPVDPDHRYAELDVIAEMQMLGAAHRTGYHN